MLTSTNGLPLMIRPVNNISPFTYRDGETYLEILYRLRNYITGIDGAGGLVNEFTLELDRIIAEFNDGLATWDARFDAFIANITAELRALNDEAMADLIIDTATATHAALGLWADAQANGNHPVFYDVTKPPFNVVFDAPVWTPAIVAQNTAGLRLATQTVGTVLTPAGTCEFLGEAIQVSGNHFHAAGVGATIFRINAAAPRGNRGFVTPAGVTQTSLGHFSFDGNEANRTDPAGQGGIYGTNISVVNATAVHIEKIHSYNPVQHCFDITTPVYGNAGDGAIIPGPSEQISVTDCTAKGYGDDGFTTHGSGIINFTRCRSLGTRHTTDTGYVNSNGFEFDDYSYNVTATDCYATGSAHGFEVKAHGNMSAGRMVRLINCVAEYNEVNFSLRHIGHHVNYPGAPAVPSLTAKNVQLTNCTGRFPSRVFFGGTDQTDGDVPDDQTPPGKQYHNLTVGAYRGVTFDNCHFISDPTFNYAGSPNALVHYLAEDVTFNVCHFSGHTTGSYDIQATGGNQPAKNTTIVNCTFKDSAPSPISCGSLSAAIIQNNSISRNVPGSPNLVGIRAYGNNIVRGNRIDATCPPFQTPYWISNTFYSTYETPLAANVSIGTAPA